MKRFKNLILIILCLSLLLSGCGGKGANGENDNNSNNNNTSVIEKDEYSLSEYLSSGETIWFLTDGLEKDADVNEIYVLEADGTMYYCDMYGDYADDWSLGDVEQMEDSEIVSYVKAKYEEDILKDINRRMEMYSSNSSNFDYKVSTKYAPMIRCTILFNIIADEKLVSYIIGEGFAKDVFRELDGVTEGCKLYEFAKECYQKSIQISPDYRNLYEFVQSLMENSEIYAKKYLEWAISYIRTELEPYKNNIKPAQYKLALTSDGTGNNTENEFFVFQESVPLSGHYDTDEYCYCSVTEWELSYIYPYESSEGETNCANIYDSWYGGYKVEDDHNNEYFLLTRMSEPKIFNLDPIGTDNISVDIDIDTMFDESPVLNWE